jgi:hypothetical protein
MVVETMKNIFVTNNHKFVKLLVVSPFVLIFSILSFGCGYNVYNAKYYAMEYSFQYRKSDYVNPRSPFTEIDYFPGKARPIENGSHINISTKIDSQNNKQRIDAFTLAYYNNEHIKDFSFKVIQVTEMIGCEMEGISYSYTGYTTIPVSYEGIFVTFKYKEFAFEVDFLFRGGEKDTETAFNLFKATFKIKEINFSNNK